MYWRRWRFDRSGPRLDRYGPYALYLPASKKAAGLDLNERPYRNALFRAIYEQMPGQISDQVSGIHLDDRKSWRSIAQSDPGLGGTNRVLAELFNLRADKLLKWTSVQKLAQRTSPGITHYRAETYPRDPKPKRSGDKITINNTIGGDQVTVLGQAVAVSTGSGNASVGGNASVDLGTFLGGIVDRLPAADRPAAAAAAQEIASAAEAGDRDRLQDALKLLGRLAADSVPEMAGVLFEAVLDGI
ncbi:MAG: hypothetical protein AAF467_25330 [Actinomycetota bacterium]